MFVSKLALYLSIDNCIASVSLRVMVLKAGYCKREDKGSYSVLIRYMYVASSLLGVITRKDSLVIRTSKLSDV